MTLNDLVYSEITQLHDPSLLPWLDLYETSFPPSERILESGILQDLLDRESGQPVRSHLITTQDASGEVLGMAMYTLSAEHSLACLWYLAVASRLRSQGIGGKIYQEILRRAQDSHLKAVIFEVEIPEGDHVVDALRRIHFYRKQGAFLLEGIHYMQHVGWHQDPIPMQVMVHPLEPLSARDTFDLARIILGDSIEQTGDLQFV